MDESIAISDKVISLLYTELNSILSDLFLVIFNALERIKNLLRDLSFGETKHFKESLVT